MDSILWAFEASKDNNLICFRRQPEVATTNNHLHFFFLSNKLPASTKLRHIGWPARWAHRAHPPIERRRHFHSLQQFRKHNRCELDKTTANIIRIPRRFHPIRLNLEVIRVSLKHIDCVCQLGGRLCCLLAVVFIPRLTWMFRSIKLADFSPTTIKTLQLVNSFQWESI